MPTARIAIGLLSWSGLYAELCLTLINRVHALVQNRDPYGYKSVGAGGGELRRGLHRHGLRHDDQGRAHFE
jgi:hypothetical protein